MAPRPRPSGAERRWASVEAGRRSSAPARRTPRRRSPFVVRSALAALCWSCEAGTAKAAEQRFLLDIPRITTAELERNQSLRSGLHAYIVTDWVGSRWSASSWTLEYLRQKIPFEWVDYYPNNMEDPGSKPYLYRFEEALPQFLQKSKIPKYMQLRLGLRGWNRLKKDINPKPVPEVFWDDDSWIGQCMKKPSGKVDREAVDNFFVTQQWKFLLIGEKGTSMFFHKDGTAASSWQAQIVGKKRWTLCPNSQSHLLDVNINTFKPDYTRFPKFAKALCGQVTLGYIRGWASSGKVLWRGDYWNRSPRGALSRDRSCIARIQANLGSKGAEFSCLELAAPNSGPACSDLARIRFAWRRWFWANHRRTVGPPFPRVLCRVDPAPKSPRSPCRRATCYTTPRIGGTTRTTSRLRPSRTPGRWSAWRRTLYLIGGQSSRLSIKQPPEGGSRGGRQEATWPLEKPLLTTPSVALFSLVSTSFPNRSPGTSGPRQSVPSRRGSHRFSPEAIFQVASRSDQGRAWHVLWREQVHSA